MLPLRQCGWWPLLPGALAGAVALVSCQSPMQRSQEQALRQRLLSTHRVYTQSVADPQMIELKRPPSDVGERLEKSGRVQQLDEMSGPTAYKTQPLGLGPDLTGQSDTPTLAIGLQQAIELAVRNNLDVQVAQIAPAVRQTQVAQALAAFDAVFFVDSDYGDLDTPNRPTHTLLAGTTGGDRQSNTANLTTGIRKPLRTGGTIRAQTGFTYQHDFYEFGNPSSGPNTEERANILLGITQPLLKNFGSDVATAQISLARNAQASSAQDLRNSLLTVALDTETLYWSLVAAQHQLLIEQRLLQRTIEDRDRLERRESFDVSPVRITEANSFVELRRSDVIRSRNNMRLLSDRLKALIHWDQVPVSGEVLLVPAQEPVANPISYSLLDAVSTALRHRPEMQIALLNIEDAGIRQRVADNARLPELNLDAAIRYNGMSSQGVDNAYGQALEGRYIDYLLGVQFEVPIGNRGPEALYQQRKLERRAAVIDYQRRAEQVVLEVKNALRALLTAYELTGSTQAARRAAADNLRAIEEQERAGVALTPEFLLDLKLAAQQRLADAETQEIRALTGYQIAIASYFRSVGTLLEQNNIQFSTTPVTSSDLTVLPASATPPAPKPLAPTLPTPLLRHGT